MCEWEREKSWMDRWGDGERKREGKGPERKRQRWIVAAMETGKDRDERERSIRVMDG